MYHPAHVANGDLEMIRSQHLRSLILIALSFSAYAPLSSQATRPPIHPSQVPFVGCKSDGQVGPLTAPVGKFKSVAIAPQLAQRLAYYQAQYGIGVLAPRGWYCFGTYGSSGQNLFVAPAPIASAELLSASWKGFTGPAIQLSGAIGDTSGRFEVAEVIARVFPAHKAFLQNVIAEGIEPAGSFPSSPYPDDQLTYKSSELVEYVTPANQEGLGTRSRLVKNDSPILGVAVLTGEELSLTQLSARLSPGMAGLKSAIVEQVELDTANANH
jgi:hypothetical protein